MSENSWVAQTQSQAPPLTVGTLRAEVLSWGWRLSGKKPLLSVSWFPGAQARVLWELPCQCLEVGLVWGLDLIPLCCSDPGDLRYRTSSVITPCLAALSGPQLSPLLNGCVRVMVAVLPGAWLQECQLVRDTSPGCMHCPCWLQCPGPLDGWWSAWLRHPALSGTQINETVRIRG